jgi:peptidyl-prolyl cis-trans isomerase D
MRLQQQKRTIAYLMYPIGKYAGDVVASDEDIAAYYQDHQDRYSTPEQVSLDYIELSAAQLGQALDPTEDELKIFFENHKSQFVLPEERKISHILIEVPKNAGAAAEQAALSEIQQVQERLAKGADFAEQARESSDDTGSAKQGGDLGYVGRGQLDPEFEVAAFDLQQGVVSEPVRSAFGYHLIKVTDIKGQTDRNFDDVKTEVLKEYRRTEGERLYFEQSDTLTTATFENPDSLEPAAEAMKLDVKSTPLVSRASLGPGILQHKPVIDAAFSDEVLNQGFNSQPIEIGEHDVAVVRVREHQKAAVKPLDEVRETVRKDLVSERAQVRAREQGEAALAKLREGSMPADVAKETDVEIHDAGTLGRSDRGLNPTLLGKAFELPRPSDSRPSYGNAQLVNGDYAVIIVSAVEDGDPQAVDEAMRQNIRRSLASARGSAEFQALVQALKAEADITINQDNL